MFKISFALEFTRAIKPLYLPPFQFTDTLFSPILNVYFPFGISKSLFISLVKNLSDSAICTTLILTV